MKKDSLIKKLAETVVKSQGISVHAVIDSLRYHVISVLILYLLSFGFVSYVFCLSVSVSLHL